MSNICEPNCWFYNKRPSSGLLCDNHYECTYCGKAISSELGNYHFDHVALGFLEIRKNKVIPACMQCNTSKGGDYMSDWFRKIKNRRPDIWVQVVNHNRWKKHKVANKVREIRNE